ncbi:hypothetical protein HED60_09225 [Planctomycetales bacterium ZRK34]|nr:hypothetical protein HED60_09225 [Planctomycetales bacterium ZRK34]
MNAPRKSNPRRAAGLSLVELLIALSISVWLLTAVMVALDASFHAYATAAESASTQSSSRLVMQRVMTMIRSSTLHDAYDPGDASVTLDQPANPPVQCVGIQMIDTQGQLIRLWWAANASYGDADLGDMYYKAGANATQPILESVRIQRTDANDPYLFTLASRSSDGGLLLSRATMDLTVEPGADATLALESAQGVSSAVRLVASAMPRRNLE